MLKIAVCDDDKSALLQIESDIRTYQATGKVQPEMSVRLFENGMDLINTVKSSDRFDIIFLDVIMPLINGIDTAKEIRLLDQSVKLIFLTTSPQFALDAFDVKAFSYLIKPPPKEKLHAVLNDAITEIDDIPGRGIMLKTKTGLVNFRFHSIVYMEVIGRTITIYMNTGQCYEVFGTLAEIEKTFLSQTCFIKPHRSYIVNMDHIRKLDKNEILTLGGYRIPVSKALYNEVKRDYIDYSFKRGVRNG